jgi:transposase
MTLHLNELPEVPKETVRVARAAFRKGNVYMAMRDELGVLYTDHDFRDLFPNVGQSALSPWRLGLVLVMQFAENLTDRQAADAVRGRIDWKYALSLELTDTGFDFSVLSEFRDRLLKGGAETRLLDVMLATFKARGWLKAGGRQRTDATHVIAAVHALNRIELVAAVLQEGLEEVAEAAPDWLRLRVPAEWFMRYTKKLDDYRLPTKPAEREKMAAQIGQDGQALLQWLEAADAPVGLSQLPAILNLRHVWSQQYDLSGSVPRWRDRDELPSSAEREASPHDTEARFRLKRDVSWVGYQVHLTETCDDDTPHLITQVETTPATESDFEALPKIQQDLKARDLLPAEQFVDGGYSSSELLVNSQTDFGITLVCPARPDASWQSRTPGAFAIDAFAIDWQTEQVTCPMGATSIAWKAAPAPKSPHKTVFNVRFSPDDCQSCSAREHCTRGKGPRSIVLLPQHEFIALKQSREREKSPEFPTLYANRAGIEGTISQVVQRTDARHARYIGLAKTHLQQILSATAINLVRAMDWFSGIPRATTRRSRFAQLVA